MNKLHHVRARAVLVLALAVVMVGVPLVSATAADRPATAKAAAAPAHSARLSVTVRLTHMTVRGRKANATASAVATLHSAQGTTTTTHQQVSLSAATSGGCQVLHLFLQQLHLNLLGLVANLDKVNLDVIGHANGGVLGQLFCRLSRGVTGKIATVRAQRALSASLRHNPPVMRFQATLTPKASASQAPATTPTCQVLDLILGPLNLQLLGLEVDLNQVHLNVTADPAGGALGSLFCQLSNAKITP
jgi:hypothetical protein